MTRISEAACVVVAVLGGAAPCVSQEAAPTALTGTVAVHAIARGDTLVALAARAGVDVETRTTSPGCLRA
jgi:hypothetical protein